MGLTTVRCLWYNGQCRKFGQLWVSPIRHCTPEKFRQLHSVDNGCTCTTLTTVVWCQSWTGGHINVWTYFSHLKSEYLTRGGGIWGKIQHRIMCLHTMRVSSAVTVFKPKPKTAGFKVEPNRGKLQFSGGYVTVFLEFQKWPSLITKVRNNNVLSGHTRLLPPPSEVTIWRSEVESPCSLITGHNGLMSHCGHQLNWQTGHSRRRVT